MSGADMERLRAMLGADLVDNTSDGLAIEKAVWRAEIRADTDRFGEHAYVYVGSVGPIA